jgi:two-component system, NtrC family, response regulator GlrR
MNVETTDSVTMPGDSVTRISVKEWSVEVISGPDKGKSFAALTGVVRVGSDEANDITLTDQAVSRRHLEIERTARGLVLRDLGSRNGTLLSGRPIISCYVEPNDKIDLGKTRLVIKQNSKGTDVSVDAAVSFGELSGVSESMRVVFSELRRASLEDTPLLIEGETGTGKELAARAVHTASIKRFGPFRVVDCTLITPDNIERELFGPQGAFSSAQGGVLFFDEVAELNPAVQARLLRVIETKQSPAGQPFDCRLIFCTARNLAELSQRGAFKPELMFRIAVMRVRLPPLRARKSDIAHLAKHLVKSQVAKLELSHQMLSILEGYDWPGNVRELRNVLERGALMQSTGNSSWLDMLVSPSGAPSATQKETVEAAAKLPYHEAKDRVLAEFERQYFAEVMRVCNYDFDTAEKRTGLSMQSLYRLLKKNGLSVRDLKNND